jgi:hypothetical protein
MKTSGVLYQTSYGKTYDLIDMWPKLDGDGIWLRLSIGSTGTTDLIPNLEKLF